MYILKTNAQQNPNRADENGDVKQASIDDSNMANYGSKE